MRYLAGCQYTRGHSCFDKTHPPNIIHDAARAMARQYHGVVPLASCSPSRLIYCLELERIGIETTARRQRQGSNERAIAEEEVSSLGRSREQPHAGPTFVYEENECRGRAARNLQYGDHATRRRGRSVGAIQPNSAPRTADRFGTYALDRAGNGGAETTSDSPQSGASNVYVQRAATPDGRVRTRRIESDAQQGRVNEVGEEGAPV
jgi:hypothetical protein